ncbi:hypothetical protein NKH72_22065 [Mesorhizobium sp. M0955]|uniref:hypothetical protein n=1 Tax=Mesorhizobium sp. M0955 TaxID=2957033 RepID=UPI00333B386C
MTKKPEPQTARQKLEAAVQRVGRSLSDLVRVFEASAEFKDEDARKSFNFLFDVLSKSEKKALLSIITSEAANGGFSLDKDYAPAEEAPARLQREEQPRMVGERRPTKKQKPTVDPEAESFLDDD